MKKNRATGILFCASVLLAASMVYAEGVPNVDLMISDTAGRLVYRGNTDGNGVFASHEVAPGNYILQFRTKNAVAHRTDYAIYAAAGHQRVVADAVAGSKLAGSGVAMRLKATKATPIIGQVALGGVNALGTKIVKGRRYVLAPPQTGDLGPRWVEEGTTANRNVTRISVEDGSLIKANKLDVAR
jgi:hypothetical protein